MVIDDPLKRFMEQNECLWSFTKSRSRSLSLFKRCTENREEADSAAAFAMCKALDDFKRLNAPDGITEENWPHFYNYCVNSIWYALLDEFNLNKRPDEPLQCINLDLIPREEPREIAIDISEHTSVLTDVQLTVVEHLYGINDAEQLSLAELSERLGISVKAVRDTHAAAIAAMRKSVFEAE